MGICQKEGQLIFMFHLPLRICQPRLLLLRINLHVHAFVQPLLDQLLSSILLFSSFIILISSFMAVFNFFKAMFSSSILRFSSSSRFALVVEFFVSFFNSSISVTEHVLATRASTCFLHVRARYLFVRARLLFKNVRPGQLKTPCSVYLCTFSSKGIFILGTFQTTKWWVGCLRLLVVNMGDLEYVNFCRYLLSLS